MDNIILSRRWVQGTPVTIDNLTGTAFTGEAQAHTFRISGVDAAGADVQITGTVTGAFLAPNNTTIPLTGTLTDGVAEVTMTSQCYELPGRFILSVYAANGDTNLCIYCGVGYVFCTETDQVAYPSAAIPDITQLIQEAQDVIDSIPEDFTALTTEVADIKSINKIFNRDVVGVPNPIDTATWIDNANLNDSGATKAAQGWKVTEGYIETSADSYKISYNNSEALYIVQAAGYTSSGSFVRMFANADSSSGVRSFTIDTTSVDKIRIATRYGNPILSVYPNDGKIVEKLASVEDDVGDLKSALANPPVFSIIRNGKVYGNLWDEDTKAYGYYDTTPTNLGALITGGTTWYYSPTYIPVNVGDVIVYNNSRPIVCAYDGEGNIVACTQPSWSGYTVPSGVAFLRFSVTAASATGMCIFVNGTSQLVYKQKTQLYIPNLINKRPTITVAANGDYTSLTRALYETYEEHPDVYVKVGTYDIVAEYKALFGNDIFDTMTYETTGMKGFQWGLYIDDRTVTFAAGAKVVCDMSAYTNDGTRRFSPFNLGMNAVIDGLDCYAVNPYYIIHDDFGDASEAYTNIIRNCKLVSPEPAQGNVIGGGCKMYSTNIVDNCWLDNGNNRPVTMRYHNTNVNGATPVVIIKNTRANGKIRLNYYGSQTTKMSAYVNNCKASAIEKADETTGSVDNVDLYEWCNEVD